MNRSLDTVVYSLVLGSALALTGAAFAQGAADWAGVRAHRADAVRLEPVTITISSAAFEATRADVQRTGAVARRTAAATAS